VETRGDTNRRSPRFHRISGNFILESPSFTSCSWILYCMLASQPHSSSRALACGLWSPCLPSLEQAFTKDYSETKHAASSRIMLGRDLHQVL
jgi:hypothetical protein